MAKEFKKRLLSSLILIPLSIYFIIQGSVFFIFFLSLIFLVSAYEWLKMLKKNYFIKVFGLIFLLFSFYSAYFIREDLGLHFFLFILLICIFTDLGGYVFGKTFRGPKLTKISPNKTYTGVLGSFLFSFISGLIFMRFTRIDNLLDLEDLLIFLIILFISLISQIGDLIISYFKRKAKLKDTGKILPGHGGLLDRIDGLIFVIPTIYILNLIR